jgi:hypothetical protein
MDLPRVDSLSRRVTLRVALAVLVFVLLLPAAYAAVNPQSLELGAGTVEEPAAETTYVSVQGFHFAGYGKPKKPARLVAADRNGSVAWRFDGEEVGARWFYDIDPTADGDLFVTATYEGGTVVFEYDTATEAVEWRHDMPGRLDTHDATRLSEDRILVAHMRNTRNGVSDDRLYVENTTTGDAEWEWLFREHYPNGTDGGFDADWTHVNDVDVVGPDDGYVLASPRNFDQVILVDRSDSDIVMRLGRDNDHGTLFEQHNPDYLERDDGTPVILVSDSENDRIVEYERDCAGADPRLGADTPPESCEWELVWSVGGFNWPRDADRLPNGNTLVTDTLNHRVVEITPEGEVVWEFYAAWAPYDAERGEKGSNGPTMADHGTTGSYTVSGGGDGGPAARYHVADAIADFGSYTPVEGTFDGLATRYSHIEPWFRPVWMGSWAFLSAVLGVLLAVGWGLGEALSRRERLATAITSRRGD